MATRTVRDESIKALADAIRAKGGTTEALQFPDGMVEAVEDIKTQPDLQDKTITPTAEDQTVSADSGYDGLGAVTVAGDADLVAANIKRGVDIFGVTGKYNGPSSSAGTFDVVKLTVNGQDYSVDGTNQDGLYMAKLPLGTTVGLDYTGANQFLHWLDQIGKVQGGGAKACSVQLNADTTLELVVLSADLPGQSAPYSAYIEFMSEYTQVVGAGTWSSADSSQQHTLPALPYKLSAKCLGWTLDGTTVCTAQDILNSIDGSFAYKEIRGLYENVVVPVTITVGNNLDDTTFTAQGTRGKNTQLQKPAAGYEGYDVHYWSWDKEGLLPLSYQTTCRVYPSHDTTVYIQYVPAGAAIQRPTAITITGMYSALLDDGPRILTMVTRDVSSTDTVKRHGLLVARNGDVQEETAEQTMVLGSDSVTVKTSTGTSRRGVLTVAETVESENTVLWVRGYCTFADSTGTERTVYSEVRSATYAELAALEKEEV